MTQQDPKTTDTTSLATTLVNDQEQTQPQEQPKRQSWLRRHLPGGSSKSHESKEKGKKDSISDSGPFIFAFDPAQGKEVLQKNPHWPNEDTWKREEETKGQWAMGGEMGQQNQDFGGTVG